MPIPFLRRQTGPRVSASGQARRPSSRWSGLVPLAAMVGGTLTVALGATAFVADLAPRPPAVVQSIAAFFHLPIARLDRAFVSYGDFRRDRQAIARFAVAQQRASGAPTAVPSTVVEQIALDGLLRSTLVRAAAAARGLQLTDEEVRADFEKTVAGAGLRDVADQLQQQFGLSVADYQRAVVRPALLKERLQASIAFDDAIDPDLKPRAEAAAQAVAESKEAFPELVKRYSEDETTVDTGGDLGVRRRGELPDPVFEAAVKLKPDERSELIRSAQGFHILEAVASTVPTADGTPTVQVRHILIRAQSVDAYVSDLLRTANIAIYRRGLRWDRNTARVQLAAGWGGVSRWSDLNRRPTAYEAVALPAELHRRIPLLSSSLRDGPAQRPIIVGRERRILHG